MAVLGAEGPGHQDPRTIHDVLRNNRTRDPPRAGRHHQITQDDGSRHATDALSENPQWSVDGHERSQLNGSGGGGWVIRAEVTTTDTSANSGISRA